MTDEIRECYRQLELEVGAPLRVVKGAYRELIKVWRPDRFPSDPKFQKRATEKTKAINDAYQKLTIFLSGTGAESNERANDRSVKEAVRMARDAAEAKRRRVWPKSPPQVTRPARRFGHLLWIPAVIGILAAAAWKQFGPPRAEGPTASAQANRAPLSGSSVSAPAATNLSATATEKQKDSAATMLNTKANNLLRAGDNAGAIQAYKEAIALTPNDEDLHFNLGIAYSRNNDVTNAEHEYEEALRLLPDYPEVHNNLGNLLMRVGRPSEAEEHFLEALKEMPEYSQAHNNLGILRERQSRREEALHCFQKAVKYDTNFWEAHFNLGNSYLHLKDPEKAIAEFRETLRINPSFEAAQKALAKAMGAQTNTAPPPPAVPDQGK
jgi:Tfp pilus assembly protein PilF